MTEPLGKEEFVQQFLISFFRGAAPKRHTFIMESLIDSAIKDAEKAYKKIKETCR